MQVRRRYLGLCMLAALLSAAAHGQPAPDVDALAARQAAVRDEYRRLEDRMVRLVQLLAEREPDQARRLQAALDDAGRRQLRDRVAEAAALLERGRLGAADAAQQALLADMRELLTVLTSAQPNLDRLQAERERLAQLKAAVDALAERQMTLRMDLDRATGADANQPREAELEQLQRAQQDLRSKAAELHRRMRGDDDRPPAPGARQIAQAGEHMQAADDELGRRDADAAAEQQQQALAALQAAQNELDDALRQVRREEREQALADLETRFREMLALERAVAEALEATPLLPPTELDRAARLRLDEAEKQHGEVATLLEQTQRLLVDEGSTTVLPFLTRELRADVDAVAARLASDNASAATRTQLAAIIAQLELILDAVAQQRAAEQQQALQMQMGQAPTQPLLPGSAELKLLRASQVRLNEQTAGLDQTNETAAQRQTLAARQRALQELTRKMRKAP